jgi:hypothetical protein
MSDPLQWVHDHRPTAASLLSAAAVDPHGTDGVHYYGALRFIPVPGNAGGLAAVSAEADRLVVKVRAVAAGLDRVRMIPGWRGGDAAAFLASTDSLAPLLRRYSDLLSELSPLVTQARSVLRDGKKEGESLEAHARSALANLPGGLLPHHWSLVQDLSETREAASRYTALLRSARDLADDTLQRLIGIGHRIEALSTLAPHAQQGFDRRVDDVVDESGFFDRALLGAPIRAAIDAFPAEAHLAAGVLGDVSSYGATLAVDFGPGAGAVYATAVVAGLASTSVDARLYQTGATNAQGQEIVTRNGLEASVAAAVPIPFVSQRLRAVPRTAQIIGRVARNGARVQRAAGAIAPGLPTNGPQAVGLVAGVAGVPLVPSIAGYLDDKGVMQSSSRPPDIRLTPVPHTNLPACPRSDVGDAKP